MAELTQMLLISIGDLENNLGVRKLPGFIQACEAVFQNRIVQIGQHILEQESVRAVFVSGPTASGKTTFSDRLATYLSRSGRPARVLSLDDYYQTESIHYDEQGRPDFETIDMLDTEGMIVDFTNLLSGQTVQLPTFDFVRRQRLFLPEKKIRLDDNNLVIVEGLHGLSEKIIGHLPAHQVYGIYIMPWCTLLNGRQLLGSRDLRMLRRISRDVLHRGSTALSTIDYWPMIDQTEDHFFHRYLARADAYVNSCLAYEFCIIPTLAAARIRQSLEQHQRGDLPGSIYLEDNRGYADLPAAIEEAASILNACSHLPTADPALVPQESILQEFI
jgi:uridine kinase